MPGRFAGLIAACALATPPTLACGYEDPQSVAMGALNFAYPDALHVGTAIWQAQMEGILPRSATPATPSATTVRSFAATSPAASVGDPSGVAALWEVLRLMDRVRDRLAPSNAGSQSALAVVFASKMLWTRFVPTAQGLAMQPHAQGPLPDDVVVVTESLVLAAVVDAKLTTEQAFDRGLIRLYGDEAARAKARNWLNALTVTGATK